ncbi:helix-turn-helix domain-containing protein, partial [Vibrio parahaemolyticus]|nr:helix-turn-helix domain-containing protein [Vibrio parahaemolyticus]
MKEIAIKQRFYPTDEQAELLARTFGCVRTVYNRILRWRTDAYRNDKIKVNYSAASSRLTELKKDPELSWLNDVSCVPLQQSLRHQQAAFKNFFEGRAKYPVEKKKR